MSAPSISWQQSYQQLDMLSAAINTAKDAESLLNAIQLAREINRDLQQLFDRDHTWAIAQLSVINTAATISARRTMKCWLLLTLWSRLKHWPNARRDALRLSAILAGSYQSSVQVPSALALAALLKKVQTGGLLTTILAGTYHKVQKRTLWQVHPDSPLLTLALTLVQALQHNNGSTLPLKDVIAQQIISSTEDDVLAALNILASLAPALYLCGRIAEDALGRVWFICKVDNGQCHAMQYWPEQARFADTLSVHEIANLQLLPPLEMHELTNLRHVVFPALAVAEIPTPNMLFKRSLLPRLRQNDLTEQIQLLEPHQQIVHFLLDNASESNRQQTLINRLRHALAMFGQTQAPYAVARAELAHYLTLQASNQHPWLLQLQQTLHFAINLISQRLDLSEFSLSHQEAGLLAACCSAPLWHHPTLQAVPLSKLQQHELVLGQLCQHYLLEPVRSQRLTAALLQHYGIAGWADAAIRQYQLLPTNQSWPLANQRGLFLRLCWQLTFSVFCYPSSQQHTQKLLQLAHQVLRLPETSILSLQADMLDCPALFYPLPHMFCVR